MADQQREVRSENTGGAGDQLLTQNLEPVIEGGDILANPTPSPHLDSVPEDAAPVPLLTRGPSANIRPLHRSSTTPGRPPGSPPTIKSSRARPRGHTETGGRSQNLSPPPSSSSNGQTLPQKSASEQIRNTKSTERQQESTSAQRPEFISTGLRPRMGTWAQPNISRGVGGTIRRRPTVLMASGRAADTVSNADFSLAGQVPPPVEIVTANQPYVDPGYTQLNPAYDQPVNTRPVWGLAKPLPRVLRSGMIPSQSQIPQQQQQDGDAGNEDVEQGKSESNPRIERLASQLSRNTRQKREQRLLQSSLNAWITQNAPSPISPQPASNDGNEAYSPFGDPIEADPLSVNLSKLNSVGEERSDVTLAEAEQLDEDLDNEWIAYRGPEDEVHNLPTYWSVIRLRFREPLAELLAVTVQLTLGFSADLAVTTSKSQDSANWAWGLATMIGIYIAGGISGAHLNPAVSIMLWIYRGFPLRKVPIYILAQILGAFLAGLISFGLFKNDITEFGGSDLASSGTLASFITYPRHTWIDASTAIFTEFTGTAILAITVLALGDDANAPPGAGMSAFILGLVITALCMCFSYNTGAALNPARDFGPRLSVMALGYGTQVFKGGYWIYGPWCSTIAGAVVGGFLYDSVIFVGGESPVNYPRNKIMRAEKKWKKKWAGRIRNLKRGKGRSAGQKL